MAASEAAGAVAPGEAFWRSRDSTLQSRRGRNHRLDPGKGQSAFDGGRRSRSRLRHHAPKEARRFGEGSSRPRRKGPSRKETKGGNGYSWVGGEKGKLY